MTADVPSTQQLEAAEMSDTGRYVIWCPGAVLAVFGFLLVAAPSYMAPLFDDAVNIAGLPAGLVIFVGFWLVLSLVGLIAIRLARRADARLAILVGMVVVAAISFLLAPAVILAIKNLKV